MCQSVASGRLFQRCGATHHTSIFKNNALISCSNVWLKFVCMPLKTAKQSLPMNCEILLVLHHIICNVFITCFRAKQLTATTVAAITIVTILGTRYVVD